MSSKSNQNFLDPRTIMAIVLVGIAWLGWQFHMQSKYPHLYEKNSETEVAEKINESNEKSELKDKNILVDSNSKTLANKEIQSNKLNEANLIKEMMGKKVSFEDQIWSFDISPLGMGLENIKLKDFTNRDGSLMKIGRAESSRPFSTNVIGKSSPLVFNIKRISDVEFVGKANYGKVSIEKRMIINSEKHFIDTSVLVSNVAEEDGFSGVTTYLNEGIQKIESGVPFLPQFERQEAYVFHDGEEDRIIYADEDVVQNYSKVKVAALGTQYFAQALLDKSDVMPDVKASVDIKGQQAFAVLSHQILSRKKDFKINYLAYAGPKSLNLLSSIDGNLAQLIDFGWFGGLAEYILKTMRFFHSLFGNWGIAIILLTILVRFIVLPFHLMSMRSMKKMQAVQPQIKALREKYKEEPQKLNQEMMVLFKTNKVNPLGGCLPMLLQFPVFIALYQMLGQSVELYQAPFAFWIQDLSLKDPYYVLPVLMGVTMFLQQKITPNTMDPAQQKIFMFMPVMFSVFMLTLPSGLTLYIFISALFAVIQQYIFMKEKKLQTAS